MPAIFHTWFPILEIGFLDQKYIQKTLPKNGTVVEKRKITFSVVTFVHQVYRAAEKRTWQDCVIKVFDREQLIKPQQLLCVMLEKKSCTCSRTPSTSPFASSVIWRTRTIFTTWWRTLKTERFCSRGFAEAPHDQGDRSLGTRCHRVSDGIGCKAIPRAQYEMLQNILSEAYEIPAGFCNFSTSLVNKLLVLEPSEKLGAQDARGYPSIRAHPFFEGL